MLRRALFACLVVGFLLPGAATASEVIPDRFIVVYEDEVRDPDRATDARERSLGFEAGSTYSEAVEGFAAELEPEQVEALRDDPRVRLVEPDRRVRATSVPVATGDAVPPGLRRIGAATPTEVRSAAAGAVAVLDTGVDLDHPDLDARAGTDCTGTGSSDDDNGHGTHVAGTIAARNDGAGVVGVVPGTRIYSVKVLDANGDGSFSQILCGIEWVTENAQELDIRVVNMSLGGTDAPSTCATSALHGGICESVAAGIDYVVAAGNDARDFGGSTQDVPAAFPEVLTVTAMADTDGAPGAQGARCGTERDDRYSSFSNFATSAAQQAHTIAAPGSCIRSTRMGGGWTSMSGTSMAAPHVAGLVASCIGEADGVPGPCANLTPAQVISRMRSAAASQATATSGFAGDPLQPTGSSYFGHLARVVAVGEPDPEPAPTIPAPLPAPTSTPSSAVAITPVLGSAEAFDVTSTQATLRATIDPRGGLFSYHFEYGPTAAYGSSTVSRVVSGTGSRAVFSDVSGLAPGEGVHFRLVVTRAGTTYSGADATFTTPRPVSTAPAEAPASATPAPPPTEPAAPPAPEPAPGPVASPPSDEDRARTLLGATVQRLASLPGGSVYRRASSRRALTVSRATGRLEPLAFVCASSCRLQVSAGLVLARGGRATAARVRTTARASGGRAGAVTVLQVPASLVRSLARSGRGARLTLMVRSDTGRITVIRVPVRAA